MKLLVLLVCVGVAVAHKPYIIGGDDVTTPGKHPHQGSLMVSGSHYCGLSLISTTWAATAAHCVDDKSLDSLSARFGTNDRLSGGQIVTFKSYKVHESWGTGPGSFPNDIAVVEFNEAVDISEGSNVSPIPMADGTVDHAGNNDCWITGWGYTIFGEPSPRILQEAKITVYTEKQCKDDRGSSINDGHICVGDKINGRGSCNGDSGGPLICKVNGRYELAGATSWGTFGCTTSSPSVYTRIGYFRQWIKDNSGV